MAPSTITTVSTSTTAGPRTVIATAGSSPSVVPGLALTALTLLAASWLTSMLPGVPFLVAALIAGVTLPMLGLATDQTEPGLRFAGKTLLRAGIVLLGFRLSVHDLTALGVSTLGTIVATVTITFFVVQLTGRRIGLSPGLSVLVASGFSICGNSAIAAVKDSAQADDDEVAAAVGLVTICGTGAVLLMPVVGPSIGLNQEEFGLWAGASVQDTAQVIAVAASMGPVALAVATAVKLTRILFLAPIVAAVSLLTSRRNGAADLSPATRPPIFPLFVAGFITTMMLRTSGVIPADGLDFARHLERWVLAAGLVGLGSSVKLARIRTLGVKPILLGAVAWVTVASIPLISLAIRGLG